MIDSIKVPPKLKETQEWFGSIVIRPIDENSQINPITPSGQSIEEEAKRYIAPSSTLKPHERIEIYNQQYWWRLLNTLHTSFPLVTRLFGYHQFNQTIGIPFLEKYPSNRWTLGHLGHKLPQWVEEEYHAEDKQLIYDAAKIDWAFAQSFTSEHCPTIDTQPSLKDIFQQTLHLQPHLHLIQMDYDLFACRKAFLEFDPDYWIEHDFPNLPREQSPYFFVMYRNYENHIAWKSASKAEFSLLQYFQKGASLDDACEWLEGEDEICTEALNHLQEWLQEWILRKWIAAAP